MLTDVRGWSFALVLLLASACANLPPKLYPPFLDHDIEASFTIGADGQLAFPTTTRELVVRRLELRPAPLEERFGQDGARWFRYAPGTTVNLRGSVRTYGPDGAAADELARALRAANGLQEVTGSGGG